MLRIFTTTLGFIACVVAVAGAPGSAFAQKRVALVIGNSAYQHAPQLTNPRNDAADMAAALKKVGFQVIEGIDLDKASFDRKVRDFSTVLKGADAGLFFYAGHGLQVGAQNYLVPIDAKAETEDALDWEMLKVEVVHRAMERSTNTNILFLDACRDNPLARNLARAMGTRSTQVGRGLATIESGVGTLISFSTQPGNVALDGAGRNSPFASALVKQLTSSTDDLSAMLIAVRNDVMKETQRKQVPWEHSALTGRFYFNPGGMTSEPPKVTPSRLSDAAETYGLIKDATSIAVLETYISQYKDTIYVELVRARIDELNKQNEATAKAVVVKQAEERRQVELERQRFAMLQQNEEQKRAETEAAKKLANPFTVTKPGSIGSVFIDCSDCPEMVVVPAGEFMMGSPESEKGRGLHEGPRHKVTIATPFAVGKFEVTFAEWAACAADGGCESNKNPKDESWGRGKRPVINVSWDDAAEYLTWLSKKSGKTYRLLTEAEWEYAARGGSKGSASHTPFATGATISPDQANYDGNFSYGNGNKGVYRQKTIEVGSFAGNAFGLHDMHGNVFEWVQDGYKGYKEGYSGAPTDGSAVTSMDWGLRVLRGGSWVNYPQDLRSAHRVGRSPRERHNGGGFRVARAL